MSQKYNMGILYVQIMLIGLALVSFFAYLTSFQIVPPIANIFLILGSASIVMFIWLGFFPYKPKRITFSEQKSNNLLITPEARKLHEALKERGVDNELEYDDGFKHVDICILSANLYIEVDGKYHNDLIDQWFRDLKRDLYSHNDGKSTIHIPNYYVEHHLDTVANIITEILDKRNRTFLDFIVERVNNYILK